MHHEGNFIVTKKGDIINMNRNYDTYGHNITSRHADSARGIPSKIGATDYRKRVPQPFNRLVRTSAGKLKKLKSSQKVDTS